MKNTLKLISIILLLSVSPIKAEVFIKQIVMNSEQVVVLSDGKTCFAVGKDWIPKTRIASQEWQTVNQAIQQYNWIPQTIPCSFPWRVKYNTRNKVDGSRPIKNIETGKYTGAYILPGEPCGDRASVNYKEYYRKILGGMVICTQ